MNSFHPHSLRMFIFTLVSLSWTMNDVNASDYVEGTRIRQEILVEPEDVVAHAGDTVQFACIVSKQADAVVTWCWNDFCTLGKTQFLRYESSINGPISIYQYSAYPRFHLRINERLNHYNLSIMHVSNRDEGIFQCQIQRTMRAHEARSERVHLTLITPPTDPPTLELPILPIRQGQSTNFTCLASPSKPASSLILYKNDQLLTTDSSTVISHQVDVQTRRNQTRLVYLIDDPDSSWDGAVIRCEQIYPYVNITRQSVTARIQTYYKPKVRIESQNRNPLTVNGTATFRCVAHGNPEPQFRWFANSIDLTSLTSSVINIPLSKHVHNHSIGCMATNVIGTTNSSIRLLIRYPPIIFIRPPKFVVIDLERKSANPSAVRCIVDSYPRAKISWYHYGQLISVGSTFHLTNITRREQQGIYTYRVDTEGFESISHEFVIYIKGRPLVYIEESKEDRRSFQCQVYSATPILRISWKFNDQAIESIDRSSISTICNDYSCVSKLVYDYRKFASSSPPMSHLLCIAENQYGTEQSRLYQIDTSDDLSIVLISIIMSSFILIIICSIVAIYCCCRTRRMRKKREEAMKSKLPIVYDEHYSINELIKEVGSLRTCNTSSNHTDQVSIKIESTDRLLTSLFNNNTKNLLDNLSNESSTNSSGFHSKSTTTIFNNDSSPKLVDALDINFSGISPLYTSHYQMNV